MRDLRIAETCKGVFTFLASDMLRALLVVPAVSLGLASVFFGR